MSAADPTPQEKPAELGVDADIARAALGDDLQNALNKIADGRNLTAQERDMLRMASTAEGGDLAQARIAALVRRWALGGRLNESERAEIAAYLPPAPPLVLEQAIEAPPAPQGAAPAPPAPAARVTGYKRKLADYAAALGIDGTDPTRKLKRLIATGKAKSPPDLPPFDDLPQLAAWWRRNMKWRVPDYIAALESQAPEPATSSASGHAAPASPNAKPQEAQLSPMRIDMVRDVAADESLRQVRALVSATFAQLERALAGGLTKQAGELRREWQQLTQTQRQWEKDIGAIMEERGEYLRAKKVNTEFMSLLSVLSTSFLNALGALAKKLAPQLTPAEHRAQALPYRDACFLHLRRNRFGRPWIEATATAAAPDPPPPCTSTAA